MNLYKSQLYRTALALMLAGVQTAWTQAANNGSQPGNRPAQGAGDFPPAGGGSGFDGPPPFGPGDFGPGGPGPGGFGDPMQQKTQLLKQFDKNADGWLNSEERKAARAYLTQQRGNRGSRGRGGPPGGFFGGPGGNQTPPEPGVKLTPADVKSYPDAPLYDLATLRTVFLEFENADWEKELAAFYKTDVEVPAKLTIDGKSFADVGVHFRGMSSFMMVPEGHKRSLNLSLDFLHKDQQIGGYHSLELLNSHEDPSFIRTVLYGQIAKEYVPSPKANFVRVVINGESWGIYVNAQPFDKNFIKDWYATSKGARWKVPGSPNGRGGLNYLGEDVAAYQRIYELKTKEDTKSWADFIKLCKVLNDTPAERLEQALAPLLDIDGALKFLALDNALVNGDGFWTRASDYNLYQDKQGKFHIIPHDVNETFSSGGGPGGPGGPGGRGGPGGPGGFGPGMIVARQMIEQADQNQDQKLSPEELAALADAWFNKLDADRTGKVSQEQFMAKLNDILPPPPGFGGPGGGMPGDGPQRRAGRGGFDPAMFLGPGLFIALDANRDGSITQAELKATFAKWFGEWDADKRGWLSEETLRTGLNAALPRPNFGGPGGRFGGPGGGRGPGGPGMGGGPRGNGLELDPLANLNDTSKPLLSKLLAVPALRTRYLGYVHDIAERWLDWKKLGPLAQQCQAVIAAEVKLDTRKLDSFEAFSRSLEGGAQTEAGFGPGREPISLKNFAEKRRAFLLNYREAKKSGT